MKPFVAKHVALVTALLIGAVAVASASSPAFARRRPPPPPPCPIDESLRIASAESFARLESLRGCTDVIVAAAKPDERFEPVPPPVRSVPSAQWRATLAGYPADAQTSGDTSAPKSRRRGKADAGGATEQRVRIERVMDAGTPYIKITPLKDEPAEDAPGWPAPPAVAPIAPPAAGTPARFASADAILALRPVRYRTVHDDTIARVAARHRVDPLLLHAVITQESGYRTNAVSHVGAQGLMQIMPATGASLGVPLPSLRDPEANIDAGARLLRKLAARYDSDFALVLAAYNAGEGAVRKYGNQVPPYAETQNYVRSVLAKYQQLVSDHQVAAPLAAGSAAGAR